MIAAGAAVPTHSTSREASGRTTHNAMILAVTADTEHPVDASMGVVRRGRIRGQSELRPKGSYVRLVDVGGLDHRQYLSRAVDRCRCLEQGIFIVDRVKILRPDCQKLGSIVVEGEHGFGVATRLTRILRTLPLHRLP